MTFYKRMQATASRLTAKYGSTARLMRGSSTIATCSMVFVENKKDPFATTPDSSPTTQETRQVIIPAVATPPSVGDTLMQGARTWRVMEVIESKPGATVTHYRLVVM